MELQEHITVLEDKVKAAEALLEVMRELIKAKDATIEALKANHIQLVQVPYIPYNPVTVPNLQPPFTITCQHEYPSMWGGTGAPQCTKCHQPMFSPVYGGSVTLTNISGSLTGNTTEGKVGVGGCVGITYTGNACASEMN